MIQVFYWREGGKYILSNFVVGEGSVDDKRTLITRDGDQLDPERCFLTKNQCLDDHAKANLVPVKSKP